MLKIMNEITWHEKILKWAEDLFTSLNAATKIS
jgi:hypothetical protein